MTTEFGERMVSARLAAGMSQAELAKAVGLKQGTISELERIGHGSNHAYQLAAVMGVSPNWLSTGEGHRGEMGDTVIMDVSRPPERRVKDLSRTAIELGLLFDEIAAGMSLVQRAKASINAIQSILDQAIEGLEAPQATPPPLPTGGKESPAAPASPAKPTLTVKPQSQRTDKPDQESEPKTQSA